MKGISLSQDAVQFSLAQVHRLLLAERSSLDLRKVFLDTDYHVAKRGSAGAIADKSFIVFKFNVIAVDITQADDGAERGDRRHDWRISHFNISAHPLKQRRPYKPS